MLHMEVSKATMDRLLDSKEIAEYLNMEAVTVRRKAAKGEIPAVRIGNRFRFDKAQIDKWLLQNKVGRRMHILIVDDEDVIRQLFTSGLNNSSYQVTTTAGSMEALALVDKKHFDLIFLDLVMPEIDGSELFRRIRQKDKHVPVVIITGYPDNDLMNKAMEQGPLLVMKKPFDNDDILQVVHSFAGSMKAKR